MIIVKPEVQHFTETPTDYNGNIHLIELAGRCCYNSEDRITATSAEPFIQKLIDRDHTAILEHSNLVMRCGHGHDLEDYLSLVEDTHLSRFTSSEYLYIGGNLRAWMSVIPVDSIKELYQGFGGWSVCSHEEIPNELRRYTAKFLTDRGVTHELVRHRLASFAQRSTRYCNEGVLSMRFVEPWWLSKEYVGHPLTDVFLSSCQAAEAAYQGMLASGATLQAARAVLPSSLATEIWMTTGADHWRFIKGLRSHPSAHPDMVRLMGLIPWEVIK